MSRSQMLSLIAELTNAPRRARAAQDLAKCLGADDLIVFVMDPEIGAPLPAPGFSQTLPQGRVWRTFLQQCLTTGGHAGELPFPDAQTRKEAVGVAADDGTVLVLIGGKPDPDAVAEVRLLLPLLGAALRGERAALTAAGQTAAAREAAAYSESLAGVLDATRAELQDALHGAEREIVQRKQAERLVSDQREWFRVTLGSIGDAVMTTNTQGRVTYLNSVAQDLTGWTQEEAAGQRLETVFQIINENSRQPVENPVERVLREGMIVGLANHAILIGKDGTERPIDDSAAPIRDGSGNVIGVVLVFRDVTEQRKAEEALAASEERSRFIMDSMPQKIFTAAPEGEVDYFNPVWSGFTGLSFETIRDWGWTQIIHPDDVEANMAVWRRSIDTGEPFQFQHRFRRADGEYRWHISRAAPMRDNAGKIVMWIGSNTEIHDLKTAEEALQEADRRKDEFLAILAHELRNPLAPIRTGLELMRMAGDDRAMVEEVRTTMEGQTQQLVRLVDDLLDVSRITSGKITLRKERVELASVVHNAVEAARSLMGASRHELIVTLPSQPVPLDGDPTRLAQILSNLLTNAARYTRDGGRIGLAAERQGSDVVVTVKDNGIGIPAEMLDRIFEMFTQVDRSLERSHSGLGIGLTLVKRLVEMHGGSVEARSEGPDQGSEFAVRLPILIEQVQELHPPHDDRAAPSSRLRILIADDNQDAATMLGMVVKRLGHEVRTAHDGLEAVDAAAEFRPDIVLMDLGMPKLNGYEAARRMREQAWGERLILVALTGWGQEEDKQRTREAGFDRHLVKPVEIAVLRKLLADHQPNPA